MKRPLTILFGRQAARMIVLAVAVGLIAASGTLTAEIVDHPDKLVFEELNYKPPAPKDYRQALKAGAVAFVAENPEVPTLQVTVLVRTGSMYEPVEKAGLADMTGYLMRNGGVEGMTSKELTERLARLAGTISIDMSGDRGTVQLFCLSKDADEGLALLEKVLRSPVFEQEALELYRKDVLSDLEQRNANTRAIEAREWQFLMYGDHPSTIPFRRTVASVNSITREEMIAFHKKYFFPKNFIFAVSGQFKTEEILAKLNDMLADWPDQSLELPRIPDQIPDPAPGVYMIKKDDVNQSRIRLGHIGVRRDIPDQYALLVMNDILGGGGFTSRIVRRVRSDEGLAYSAGSSFGRPVLYPGTFRAFFQTKHATAAFGTDLILIELDRIRTEKCDEEVVENAKASFISNLVKAKKYLQPDKLVFLVIGDPEAVEKGSDKHDQRYSDFGDITILPMRDPLTLEAK